MRTRSSGCLHFEIKASSHSLYMNCVHSKRGYDFMAAFSRPRSSQPGHLARVPSVDQAESCPGRLLVRLVALCAILAASALLVLTSQSNLPACINWGTWRPWAARPCSPAERIEPPGTPDCPCFCRSLRQRLARPPCHQTPTTHHHTTTPPPQLRRARPVHSFAPFAPFRHFANTSLFNYALVLLQADTRCQIHDIRLSAELPLASVPCRNSKTTATVERPPRDDHFNFTLTRISNPTVVVTTRFCGRLVETSRRERHRAAQAVAQCSRPLDRPAASRAFESIAIATRPPSTRQDAVVFATVPGGRRVARHSRSRRCRRTRPRLQLVERLQGEFALLS